MRAWFRCGWALKPWVIDRFPKNHLNHPLELNDNFNRLSYMIADDCTRLYLCVQGFLLIAFWTSIITYRHHAAPKINQVPVPPEPAMNFNRVPPQSSLSTAPSTWLFWFHQRPETPVTHLKAKEPCGGGRVLGKFQISYYDNGICVQIQ